MPASNRIRKSSSDKLRDRAALRDTAPAVAALVVAEATLVIWNPDPAASVWNLLWLLLPILPALWLVWAQLRILRRSDEFQRTLQLESMAVGFGTAIMLALLGGLAGGAQLGNPTQWLQVTFIASILAWVGTLAFKSSQSR